MSPTPRTGRSRLLGLFLLPLLLLLLGLTSCGSDDAGTETGSGDGSSTTATNADGTKTTTGPVTEEATLRLGYFANVTHAPAIVGVEHGEFEAALGDKVTLETSLFNAGPEAIEALLADGIDASYIGPNPAINAFAQSEGEAIRIISGSTSGGAFLVVKPGTTAEDLAGKKIATPQLGNTQDVALRVWLKEQGYSSDTSGGGDVSVLPQANADTLTAFKAGDIDGAWVPEPWASRLIKEGGGEVLVDEADLWPDGEYVTTHLIVRTDYLEEHPEVVKALLQGNYDAATWIEANTAEAETVVNDAIEKYTEKRLDDDVVTSSFENLTFTFDPIASSLEGSARDAEEVGLLEPVDLAGIYDLTLLNEILEAEGQDPVEGF